MSEPASSTVPSAIAGPAGGAVIGILLFPTGCNEYVAVLQCAAGAETNFLGWTLGGLVGTVSELGAGFIGVVIGALAYWGLKSYEDSQHPAA